MKILAVEKKKDYEFTYLIPGVYTNSEVKKAKDAVLDAIKKNGGEVVSEEDWGKKRLAYVIKKAGKKHEEAFYTHMIITFPSENVQKFEKEIYLNQTIIRHLLVVATDEPSQNASDGEGK